MIRVTLGTLARSGVESYFGADVSAGVRGALVRYARTLKAGRTPIAPPRFLPDPSQCDAGDAVELAVDAEDEAVFERQALSRGTTMDQLAAHAVLVYLAELDFLGVAPRFGTGSGPGPAD